jgi:hypothetical protein
VIKTSADAKKICKCECHVEGREIMEFMPCCKFCGEKYIFPSGEINYPAYMILSCQEKDTRKRKNRKQKL